MSLPPIGRSDSITLK